MARQEYKQYDPIADYLRVTASPWPGTGWHRNEDVMASVAPHIRFGNEWQLAEALRCDPRFQGVHIDWGPDFTRLVGPVYLREISQQGLQYLAAVHACSMDVVGPGVSLQAVAYELGLSEERVNDKIRSLAVCDFLDAMLRSSVVCYCCLAIDPDQPLWVWTSYHLEGFQTTLTQELSRQRSPEVLSDALAGIDTQVAALLERRQYFARHLK